jgi:hypothetical protein
MIDFVVSRSFPFLESEVSMVPLDYALSAVLFVAGVFIEVCALRWLLVRLRGASTLDRWEDWMAILFFSGTGVLVADAGFYGLRHLPIESPLHPSTILLCSIVALCLLGVWRQECKRHKR